MKRIPYLLVLICIIGCTSTEQKYNLREAVSEIVKMKQLNVQEEILKSNITELAKKNELDENELRLVSDLVFYYGITGFENFDESDLLEFSRQMTGIRKVEQRIKDGEKKNNKEYVITTPLEAETGSDKQYKSLTLATEDSTMLAAYGIITLKEVKGPEGNLPKGVSGVVQKYDYELLGNKYSGFEKPHKGHAEFTWVKQNGMYRAVIGSITIRNQSDEIITQEGSDCMILTSAPVSTTTFYPNINTTDFLTQVGIGIKFPVTEAWDKIQEDVNFIDPKQWSEYLN